MPRTLEFQNHVNELYQQMKLLEEEIELEGYYLFRNKVKRESVNNYIHFQLVAYSNFDDITLDKHLYSRRDEYWTISPDIYLDVSTILNNINELSIINLFKIMDINSFIPNQYLDKTITPEEFFDQLQFIYFYEDLFYFVFNINYNENDSTSFPLLYFAINVGEVYREFNQKFYNNFIVKSELEFELICSSLEEVIECEAELIFSKI